MKKAMTKKGRRSGQVANSSAVGASPPSRTLRATAANVMMMVMPIPRAYHFRWARRGMRRRNSDFTAAPPPTMAVTMMAAMEGPCGRTTNPNCRMAGVSAGHHDSKYERTTNVMKGLRRTRSRIPAMLSDPPHRHHLWLRRDRRCSRQRLAAAASLSIADPVESVVQRMVDSRGGGEVDGGGGSVGQQPQLAGD